LEAVSELYCKNLLPCIDCIRYRLVRSASFPTIWGFLDLEVVLEVGGQEPGKVEGEVDSEEAEGSRFLTVPELLRKKSE
jgi:hypothetical protein